MGISSKAKTPTAVSSDAFFFEKDKSRSILVLGVGNYLMGDEGVGVHLIQRMASADLPEGVDILDGGTGGFLLLSCFEAYQTVIFVDATMDGQPPGTISLLRPKFASDFPTALSVHDVGLKDMIEAVYLTDAKPDIHLFTISVSGITPMTVDLSLEVEAAIPKGMDRIFDLIREMKKEITPVA